MAATTTLPAQHSEVRSLANHLKGTLVVLPSQTKERAAPSLGVRFDATVHGKTLPHLLFITHAPWGPQKDVHQICNLFLTPLGRQHVLGLGPSKSAVVRAFVDLTSLSADSERVGDCLGTACMAVTDHGLSILAYAMDENGRQPLLIDPVEWDLAQGTAPDHGFFKRWSICLAAPSLSEPVVFDATPGGKVWP